METVVVYFKSSPDFRRERTKVLFNSTDVTNLPRHCRKPLRILAKQRHCPQGTYIDGGEIQVTDI